MFYCLLSDYCVACQQMLFSLLYCLIYQYVLSCSLDIVLNLPLITCKFCQLLEQTFQAVSHYLQIA